jgi:hypothetical protein
MVPDAPLFFSGGAGYGLLHDPRGALLVGLPLALVVYAAWRVLVRPILRGVLPQRIGERLPETWTEKPSAAWTGLWRTPGTTSAGTVALLLVALLIGLATHLLWDGFTHDGRWGTDLLPILRREIGGVALATWAHYVSSALGLVVLACYGVVALRRRPARPVQERAGLPVAVAFWAASGAGVLLGVVVGLRILIS